jgi:hypothetical protein
MKIDKFSFKFPRIFFPYSLRRPCPSRLDARFEKVGKVAIGSLEDPAR